MRTLFYKIYRISNVDGTAEVEQFQQQNEIDTYIDELMDQCVSQDGNREYVFDPGRLTTKTRLSNIIEARNRDEECLRLACRLAQERGDGYLFHE